jgi:hypothetical protein
MTDTYLISTQGGASHSFIAWLVFHLIPTHDHNLPWESLNNFSAHSFVSQYYLRYIVDGDHIMPSANTIKQFHTYADDIPLLVFVPTPAYNNFSKLEEDYPNFKYINIQFTAHDLKQLEINHFFKMHIKTTVGRLKNNSYWLSYITECEVNPDIRSGLTHLNQLTIEECFILIEKHLKQPGYSINATVPAELLNRSCTVLFSDIVNNKNKVLETLASFVSGNITTYIREQYDLYIDTQIKFNAMYCPK